MASVTVDFDSRDYPPFAVTVDIAVFAIRDDALQVVLIQRREQPCLGALALPGGFVQPDEDLDQAAEREFAEETGLRRGPGTSSSSPATGRRIGIRGRGSSPSPTGRSGQSSRRGGDGTPLARP